ncbi:unnamed protein product [Lactuca saligna]|uniref:Reverse transcriptase zinc-binding domain-containing protein n=1 Tax=Lactuca saligna TaxID=75948 RepID=A0AA35Z3Z3_LACSI|nr:unnamed protein product [Lactuca saligna]
MAKRSTYQSHNVWRAKQGRIPTLVAISNRGITVNSIICSQCGKKEETADHVLVECTFAKSVSKWILIWCQAPFTNLTTRHDVIDYALNWGNCPKKKSEEYWGFVMDTCGVFGRQEMTDYSTTRGCNQQKWRI